MKIAFTVKSSEGCAVDQSEVLKFALAALEQLKLPYAVVGSFASSVWGESRFTQDIDIVIHLDATSATALYQAFPPAEFYVSQLAIDEAVRLARPFNVIHPGSGNKIDFMVARPDGWSQKQIDRRVKLELLPNVSGYVASPEDVILGKLIYFREGGSDKHLRDITGILKVSDSLVDHFYLDDQASMLGVLEILRNVQDSCK